MTTKPPLSTKPGKTSTDSERTVKKMVKNWPPSTQPGKCCQCHKEGSECNRNDNCACRATHTRCSAYCLVEGCANNKMSPFERMMCCRCNDESECNTDSCKCHAEGKQCTDCHAQRCVRRCCQCHKEGSECNRNDNCVCRATHTRCSAKCLVKRCWNDKMSRYKRRRECCGCNEESECNTDSCQCHAEGKQCTNCPAQRCVRRCCQCNKEGSKCNRNDNCACRATHTRCSDKCLVERCANNKMLSRYEKDCCGCNEESECNTDSCQCHASRELCTDCHVQMCVRRCCQCHNEGSECNRNDNCACRATHTRCSAYCLVERCGNNKMMQTRVLKEDWLEICTDRQPGTDKSDKANCKSRYCVLQRCDDRLSLKVYDNDKKTGTPHTLCLDTALKAAKMGRVQVVAEDGRVLCVMKDDERVSEWVVSLNSVIKRATSDTDGKIKTDGEGVQHTADSTTLTAGTSDGEDREMCEGEEYRTTPHVPRQLSEEPKVIKQGWLNIHTDPAPGEDKWDKVQTRYCVLQRQGDRYTLEVYTDEDDWVRYDWGSNSFIYWTGNVATVCLDTVHHAQLCSTLYKVVTMDDKVLCVMRETDDVMSRWVVSLNRAIMAARCQDTRQTATDSSDQAGAVWHAEDEFLNAWFPGLDTQSYIIPRVHYETVPGYDDYNVGGHKVTVLQTDRERKIQHCIKNEKARVAKSVSDVLKRVHDSMTLIKDNVAPGERFVSMTEVKCALYNNLYAGAADRNNNNTQSNPESSQASKVEWDMKDGLTDLLVIHRDRGLLLGAVTRNTGSDPNALRKDLRKAVAYLHRAEGVVKDVILAGVRGKSAMTINKTILLPNLTRQNLKDTLRNKQVRERLERCVGVQPGHDVTRFCLTKDDMAVKQRLKEWWTSCLKRNTQGDTARMGKEVYRALVARFAVPLTTVEMSLSTQPRLQLWTAGHVVHAVGEEHGRDLTRIALFPRQVELLEDTPDDHDDDDVRILHGGPGTAKTILCLLRGVSWSRDGCDRVFNIQTRFDGRAAAYLVSHQLRETVARARQGDTVARPDFTVQQVNMRSWRDEDNEDWTETGRRAVAAWCDDAARSEGRKVHIIADEADGDIISHLYRELKGRGCTVKLWAAGVQLEIPYDMTRYVKEITAPLRCPPSVVREVEKAIDMKDGTVPRYTKPPVAPPCDGPPVITIPHYRENYSGDREGHQAEGGDYPWRCEECGRSVAHTLLHTLHLGRHDNGPGEQGGLRYNDVFIMGRGIDCRPDTPDDARNSPAPFIRGLRQLGIPTRVVHHEDSEAVRRVAENSWTPLAVGDAVTIVKESTVWGLERKVVVYLDRESGVVADETGRLVSMSRSTAQLIWVKPEPYD